MKEVLTDLILMGNFIGANGASDLAEALKFNAVLTELDISMSELRDDGVAGIVEALKVNALLPNCRPL